MVDNPISTPTKAGCELVRTLVSYPGFLYQWMELGTCGLCQNDRKAELIAF